MKSHQFKISRISQVLQSIWVNVSQHFLSIRFTTLTIVCYNQQQITRRQHTHFFPPPPPPSYPPGRFPWQRCGSCWLALVRSRRWGWGRRRRPGGSAPPPRGRSPRRRAAAWWETGSRSGWWSVPVLFIMVQQIKSTNQSLLCLIILNLMSLGFGLLLRQNKTVSWFMFGMFLLN